MNPTLDEHAIRNSQIPSRDAAKEYSPRRKSWVNDNIQQTSPAGAKEKARKKITTLST
jgi:hypothetical protein